MGKNHNSIVTAVTRLKNINELPVFIKQPRFQPNILPSKITFICHNPNNRHHKITTRHPKTYF